MRKLNNAKSIDYCTSLAKAVQRICRYSLTNLNFFDLPNKDQYKKS